MVSAVFSEIGANGRIPKSLGFQNKYAVLVGF
jgi:hypothetical protein